MTRRRPYVNPWKQKRKKDVPTQPATFTVPAKPVKVEFLARIVNTLDMPVEDAAKLFGVTPLQLKHLMKKSRGSLPNIDHDEMWAKIIQLVNDKIAQCMAIREELNRKLYADTQRRAAERLRIENR